MSEINDTIQESVEHARESKLNSRVAIMVALTATVMAICNIKDGNVVQAMSQAQAHTIDAWSYFQSKSIKQSLTENTLELLKSQKPEANADLIKSYQDKISGYEKEKNEIQKKAEG